MTLAREEARRKYLEAEGLSAVRVLEELRRLAFSDIRSLFDERGNLRRLKDLTPEQAAAIASVEVVTRNITAGDDQLDTIHKLKVWDKPKALEMLAKHFKLLTEKMEISGDEDLMNRLDEWKRGNAKQ